MRQKIYVINEHMTMAQALEDVQKEPAFQTARRKLAHLYETIWEKEEIVRHISQIKAALPDVELVGVTQTDMQHIMGCYHYTYPGITLYFQFFESSDFEIIPLEMKKQTVEKDAQRLLQKLAVLPDVKGVQLLLSDPALDWDRFFDRLQEAEYDYSYFGIIAGTLTSFGQDGERDSYLFTEQFFLDRGLVFGDEGEYAVGGGKGRMRGARVRG